MKIKALSQREWVPRLYRKLYLRLPCGLAPQEAKIGRLREHSLTPPISLSCQINWQGRVKLRTPGEAGYVHSIFI
jgi:hypothetical protein